MWQQLFTIWSKNTQQFSQAFGGIVSVSTIMWVINVGHCVALLTPSIPTGKDVAFKAILIATCIPIVPVHIHKYVRQTMPTHV